MTTDGSKRTTRDELLRASVVLFARQGYAGTSMREIAAEVGIKAAALYYHFPDKQALYLAAMQHAFKDQLAGAVATLRGDDPPRARLESYVDRLVRDLSGNPDLLRLLQRERLDGDEARQRLLVREMFADPYLALLAVLEQLVPRQEAAMLARTIPGVLLFHLEAASMYRFLPGWQPEFATPDYLIRHMRSLLAACLGQSAGP